MWTRFSSTLARGEGDSSSFHASMLAQSPSVNNLWMTTKPRSGNRGGLLRNQNLEEILGHKL